MRELQVTLPNTSLERARGAQLNRQAAFVRRCQTILVVLGTMLVSGCVHDRRGLVATKTLLNAEGAFDEAAYEAALRAKFPPGSAVEELRRYVRETKGECKERDAGQIRCEIPYRAGFCWAQMIGLDVATEGSAVKEMKVQTGGLGC